MGEEQLPVTLMGAGLREFGVGTWARGELGTCPAPSPGRIRMPSITFVSRAAPAAVRGL